MTFFKLLGQLFLIVNSIDLSYAFFLLSLQLGNKLHEIRKCFLAFLLRPSPMGFTASG